MSDARQEWLDEMADMVNDDGDVLGLFCPPTARDVWLRLVMMKDERRPFRLTTPWERLHRGASSTYDMMKGTLG